MIFLSSRCTRFCLGFCWIILHRLGWVFLVSLSSLLSSMRGIGFSRFLLRSFRPCCLFLRFLGRLCCTLCKNQCLRCLIAEMIVSTMCTHASFIVLTIFLDKLSLFVNSQSLPSFYQPWDTDFPPYNASTQFSSYF